MHRRNLLTAAIKVACATAPITVIAVEPAAAADVSKVAYHLSDLDKVDSVLGNIHNHYAGMGGSSPVTIALVIHGPALMAFHLATATADVTKPTEELRGMGLALNACINSMRAQNVTLKDLLPGFSVAEKGAVVRLAELQSQGYAYLRP